MLLTPLARMLRAAEAGVPRDEKRQYLARNLAAGSHLGPPHANAPRIETLATACLLVLAAVVIRAPNLGHPSYHPDEQFYLLVGRAMLGGELPYVDVWDRKPIGLFLIFAVGAALGEGVIPYQLLATAFAAGTAVGVAALARRQTNAVAASLAGLAYLTALEPLAGGGGQAPVFGNLFTVLAALMTAKAVAASSITALGLRGAAAAGLAGLAIAIKQTAAFEGAVVGLVLLGALSTRTRSPGAMGVWGALFLVAGVLPTGLALGVFAALGHGDAFWFATVQSILAKGPASTDVVSGRLGYLAMTLLPLAVAAVPGLRRSIPLAAWLAAAGVGFGFLGNAYEHYAIPLLPALCVAAAAVFGRPGTGPLWAAVVIAWPLTVAGYPAFQDRTRAQGELTRVADTIRTHLGGGCLYVHSGPLQLYEAAGACRVTRYPFPGHLNSAPESTAIGADPEAEMLAIFEKRPTVVVTAPGTVRDRNLGTDQILRRALSRGYRRVATMPVRVGRAGQKVQIWARLPKRSAGFSPESDRPRARGLRASTRGRPRRSGRRLPA